jgi:hypothetical protein
MRYFRILLSPLVPGFYPLPEDLELFFVGHSANQRVFPRRFLPLPSPNIERIAMRLRGNLRDALIGQPLGAFFRLIQAEAVHFPNPQEPILGTGLPHLQRPPRIGRAADLERVPAALGGVPADGLRRGLEPDQGSISRVQNLLNSYFDDFMNS